MATALLSHSRAAARPAGALAARRPLSAAAAGDFDAVVRSTFPGALSNSALTQKIAAALSPKGFAPDQTLLCTSLCADELARTLEADLGKVYGPNFNLGGLSGFPFAGNTGFGAMAAHVPDDGCCLLVHGPHVGIASDGIVGQVERPGMAAIDNCCGSAIAASRYVKGITHGGAAVNTKLRSFADLQQCAVQELILPFGKRLADAEANEKGGRMKELPYALYEVQSDMVRDIIDAGKGGIKKGGLALLGGVQINTGPGEEDYFHPLRFDYYDEKGEVAEDLLASLMYG